MIAGYEKHGSIANACEVFDKISQRKMFSYSENVSVISFTGMITGYAKHGSIANALDVFDRISQRVVFSWTAMISGYVKCGSI
jgi:pentatricopeptide repeat protein